MTDSKEKITDDVLAAQQKLNNSKCLVEIFKATGILIFGYAEFSPGSMEFLYAEFNKRKKNN